MASNNEQPSWTGGQEDGGSDSDSDLGSPSVYVLQPRPLKRTTEENSGGSNKKPKNAGKLWSDEDEVSLLNGIISYRDSTGRRFNADLKAFYEFVKGNLRAHFSKEQITAKVRRLKKRFLNLSTKSGAAPLFSNPHDAHMFTISQKIWAAVANANDSLPIGVNKHAQQFELNENAKNKGKNVEKQAEEVELDEEEEEEEEFEEEEEELELEEVKEKEEEVDFPSKYPFLMGSFSDPSMNLPQSGMNFVLERLSSIGDSKLKELDDKWKQLTVQEVDLSVKKQTLMMEQVRMSL